MLLEDLGPDLFLRAQCPVLCILAEFTWELGSVPRGLQTCVSIRRRSLALAAVRLEGTWNRRPGYSEFPLKLNCSASQVGLLAVADLGPLPDRLLLVLLLLERTFYSLVALAFKRAVSPRSGIAEIAARATI